MKKLIGILLAVVLITSGLGSFAYAEGDPPNYVSAVFDTFWRYNLAGDTFTNHEVTGDRSWIATLRNYPPDETGLPVISAKLTLTSGRSFTWFVPEPPKEEPPGVYVWEFGDVPEEPYNRWSHVGVEVGVVTFYPGFDLSRVVEPRVFSEASIPRTQTLTVTVIPREAMNLFHVLVTAPEDGKVSPVIISATADTYPAEEINLFPGGHRLMIWERSPEVGKEYIYTVTIEVTPKVENVIFKPLVSVDAEERLLAGGTLTGSSVSRTTEGGTWNWSADGTYTWRWSEKIAKQVTFPLYSNIPPLAEAGVPYLAQLDVPVILDGSASTDPDGTMASYNWSFGDGDTWTGTDATVEHIYGATGLYTAELTVIDNRGARGTDTALVVVYDPAAGFATGGGWFIPGGKTSYNDDFLPEIDGTSPANFGFVVKYKKGATNPDGQLEFQYRQGDFNLHSSGMEWLVITNKNWAKFHGMATIKGLDGLFPFRVDARDGDFGGGTQPDRFIIKVYAPEDTEQSEPIYKASGDLQGGSIVIHGKGYEVTTLRLQSSLPSDHPLMTPLENFASAVEAGTNGSVRIELYPSNALVPNNELAKAVEWGDIEMGLLHSGWLRPYSPVIDGGSLPFLYNDDDGLMAAIQAGIGDLMGEQIKDITVLNWTTLGFAHLFLKDEMLTYPEDVAGLVIRALGTQAEAISQWGGTAVMMPIQDVYKALENRDIHGASFSPYLYYVLKLYEVVPYFSVDYAFANLAGLCINSDVWNSLDESARQIIAEEADNFAVEMLNTVKQLDAQALTNIQNLGVEVKVLTPEERAIWRQASQPVWERWVEEVGPVGQEIIAIALEHNPLPAPPETLRLQSRLPSNHPLMAPLENFAQAVEERTEGSVRIELYPSNALVPNNELAKAVEWGDVEMGLISTVWLRGYSRVMDGGSLPFLYNDDDGLMAAIQAGIGDLLSEELEAHNITAIDWTDLGMSHLFLKDEMLIRPEDVIEKNIRAPGIQGKAISQWGGTAVMMPIQDVYKALENRDIHGASFSPYLYYVLRLYEVVPYFSVDYAFANLAGLCINSDVWNSLDESTRQIIAEEADKFAVEMLDTVKQLDVEALQRIEGYGVEVYTLTPEERAIWRAASQPVWERWVLDVGDVGEEIIAIALEYNPLP